MSSVGNEWDGDQLLRLPEAADLLAVSLRTVNRLIDEGELDRVKIGRATRVLKSQVLAYISRQRQRVVA